MHSGTCTEATKAPLYSVKRKAWVASLAPQHKSTWYISQWRVHYPTSHTSLPVVMADLLSSIFREVSQSQKEHSGPPFVFKRSFG